MLLKSVLPKQELRALCRRPYERSDSSKGVKDLGESRLSLLLTMLFALALMSSFTVLAQQPGTAKLTADLPPGPMQAKATTACLECHEARIILQQRLSKATWTKEVDKMVKWGAVVDPGDHDALIDYLGTNFNPDKAPYDPPRSSPVQSTPEKR